MITTVALRQSAALHSVRLADHLTEVLFAAFGHRPFARHFHDVWSVGLVLTGANHYAVNRSSITAPAGQMCIVAPGDVHDGGLAGVAWSYANLFVPHGVIVELANQLGLSAVPDLTAERVRCSMRVRAGFARFFHEVRTGADASEINETGLVALSNAVFAADPTSRLQSAITPAARGVNQRALDLLDAEMSRYVGLGELAAEVGMSRFAIVRSFKRAVGLPPAQYHLLRRVEAAKYMIRAGAPIAEAAYATGFADQAHLTRTMRARLGITPGMLRR